jgi:hypothetical protein
VTENGESLRRLGLGFQQQGRNDKGREKNKQLGLTGSGSDSL